jgi:hypothetical protein
MLRQKLPSALAAIAAVAAAALLHIGPTVQDEPDSYAHYVAVVANGYCLAPERLRAALRELIDTQSAPHKIRVECAADAL